LMSLPRWRCLVFVQISMTLEGTAGRVSSWTRCSDKQRCFSSKIETGDECDLIALMSHYRVKKSLRTPSYLAQ
jgi:hypothetical protein